MPDCASRTPSHPSFPFRTLAVPTHRGPINVPKNMLPAKVQLGFVKKQAQCCEAQVALGKGSAACRGSRVFLSSTLSSSTQLKEGTKVPPAPNRGHVLTPPRYRDGVEGRGSGEMWCGNNLSSGQPSAEWETKS